MKKDSTKLKYEYVRFEGKYIWNMYFWLWYKIFIKEKINVIFMNILKFLEKSYCFEWICWIPEKKKKDLWIWKIWNGFPSSLLTLAHEEPLWNINIDSSDLKENIFGIYTFGSNMKCHKKIAIYYDIQFFFSNILKISILIKLLTSRKEKKSNLFTW